MIKILSSYLPNELQFKGEEGDMIYTLVSLDAKDMKRNQYEDQHSNSMVDYDGSFKPLLLPLSKLTEEITHKGETFVPIVRLSEIAYPTKAVQHWLNNDLNCCEMSGKYFLKFRSIDKSFDCMRFYNGKTWDYQCYVPNQLELFQKLYEWHFDLHDLIPQNLALDKSSI